MTRVTGAHCFFGFRLENVFFSCCTLECPNFAVMGDWGYGGLVWLWQCCFSGPVVTVPSGRGGPSALPGVIVVDDTYVIGQSHARPPLCACALCCARRKYSYFPCFFTYSTYLALWGNDDRVAPVCRPYIKARMNKPSVGVSVCVLREFVVWENHWLFLVWIENPLNAL